MCEVNLKPTAIILAGACATAGVVLFRGFQPEYLCILPLAIAAGFFSGSFLLPIPVVFLAGGFISPTAIPWVALAGGVFCALTGPGLAARTAGFLSCAVTLWCIPVIGAVAVVLAGASGALLHGKRKAAYILPAVIITASLFITGLPQRSDSLTLTARAYIEDEKLTWDVPDLNAAVPEVQLPAPCSGEWIMWIAIDGGGVRDSLPMTAVYLREEMLALPSGRDTLCFQVSPGDTLSVNLLRSPAPFSHPVVHITAGGEKL